MNNVISYLWVELWAVSSVEISNTFNRKPKMMYDFSLPRNVICCVFFFLWCNKDRFNLIFLVDKTMSLNAYRFHKTLHHLLCFWIAQRVADWSEIESKCMWHSRVRSVLSSGCRLKSNIQCFICSQTQWNPLLSRFFIVQMHCTQCAIHVFFCQCGEKKQI